MMKKLSKEGEAEKCDKQVVGSDERLKRYREISTRNEEGRIDNSRTIRQEGSNF